MVRIIKLLKRSGWWKLKGNIKAGRSVKEDA
jgi:hypothetical protein